MGEVENEPLTRKYRVWSDSGEWQGEGLQSREGGFTGSWHSRMFRQSEKEGFSKKSCMALSRVSLRQESSLS